jgi:hypothetical protein
MMVTLDLRTWSPDEPRAVLGQRMSPRLFAEYERFSTHFCSLAATPASVRSLRDITRLTDPSPHAEHLAATIQGVFVDAIDRAVHSTHSTHGTHGFPASTPDLLLRGLPTDLPCHPDLETYVVGPEDTRAALRGQAGVRATRAIPAGHFLGVYRGDAMFHADYIAWKLTPPTPDIHPIRREIDIDGYTASTTQYSAGEWAAVHGLEGMSPHRADTVLMTCGTYNGNMTSLVNDPSVNPLEGPSPGDSAPNTCLCEFVVGAWPVLAMFTFQKIRAGEDVRYAYGHEYWEYMKEHALRLHAVNRYGICKNW